MSILRILGVARTLTNALKTRTSASTAGLLTRLDSVATTDINKHSPLTTSSSTSGRYEPSYLDEITYEPRYEAVQLSLKGHDFAVLESYRKLALQFAPRFSIQVEDNYPIPTRQTKISHFDPAENGKEGAKVIEEFVLDTFERILMLKDVDAKSLPLFFEFLRNHQPEGVHLAAAKPDPKLEYFRYIPDMEMTVLQRKLDDFDAGKVDTMTWRK